MFEKYGSRIDFAMTGMQEIEEEDEDPNRQSEQRVINMAAGEAQIPPMSAAVNERPRDKTNILI